MRISDWSSDVCSSDLDRKVSVWALPLYHPGSPWRNIWERILEYIREAFTRVKKSIAHNGKFDNRWLRQWGVERYLTFDTMLAAHLLDENRRKSLKELAHMELGVPNWAIRSEEHTSELQSLMRISYAVFCLKKQK